MFSMLSLLTHVRKLYEILAMGLDHFLKQTILDTEEAYRRAGPVDNAGL
jgi:hypothetical protein